MGLFARKETKPRMASVEVEAKAAAGGVAMIGDYYTYTVGSFEQLALTLPTVSRSTDLMASLISDLSMKHYTRQWTGERYEEIYLPNEPWMEQLDPSVPQQFVLANLFRDLFFYGRAFLWVSSRRADDNRPATFQWLPASNIATPSQNGPQYFGMPDQIEFNGVQVDPANVITFLSPSVGLVWTGSRTVSIALHLDQFADRMATQEQVPGYLQQRGGETMSGDELTDLAQAWAELRKDGSTVGALNDYVEFVEYKKDPGEVNAAQRQYQALEMARLCSVPAYLVNAPVPGSSMTYQNAQQARQDLWLFGAAQYAKAITARLSMNDILPRGRFVEFNYEEALGFMSEDFSVAVETNVPDMEDNSR
jgi:hypothetical protein